MAKTQALDGTDLAPVKPRPQSATRQRGVVPSAELVPMQFKMPREFVRAFKVAAASNDMKFNELQRLVSSCEAAWQAQMACCYALPHVRMHLTLWPLRV